MPCKLAPAVGDQVADFKGTIGDQVQIDVHGTGGIATIQSARYADQPLAAPWQFTIVAGNQALNLLIVNAIAGDTTVIEEVCDPATRNSLQEYQYDPGAPLVRFIILGQ